MNQCKQKIYEITSTKFGMLIRDNKNIFFEPLFNEFNCLDVPYQHQFNLLISTLFIYFSIDNMGGNENIVLNDIPLSHTSISIDSINHFIQYFQYVYPSPL